MSRSAQRNMAPAPKRRKVEPVEQVTFDPDARQEYLTGFHKRKLERAKHGRELAQKKEREDRIKARAEIRSQRKREAEQRVEEVNVFMKKQADPEDTGDLNPKIAGQSGEESEEGDEEGEGWEGFEEPPAVDATDEYVDEDKFTTVTVKELDDIRDYETEEEGEEEEAEDVEPAVDKVEAKIDAKGKKIWTKEKPSSHKVKPKKKKRTFRYESKLERQTERKKQKLKNSAAAKARKEK
ncbi:hypothetical protein C1H76_2470 [Elsinoe australis]|uniref:Ribosomal RNA-processing protein 17 n=1 Tax=Elsinoe australis TaxID=40998 RepID=A0A4U7BBK1_9PEZI|nr:hypothetical protein C1H76_2470 [Elsinoe australis]